MQCCAMQQRSRDFRTVSAPRRRAARAWRCAHSSPASFYAGWRFLRDFRRIHAALMVRRATCRQSLSLREVLRAPRLLRAHGAVAAAKASRSSDAEEVPTRDFTRVPRSAPDTQFAVRVVPKMIAARCHRRRRNAAESPSLCVLRKSFTQYRLPCVQARREAVLYLLRGLPSLCCVAICPRLLEAHACVTAHAHRRLLHADARLQAAKSA